MAANENIESALESAVCGKEGAVCGKEGAVQVRRAQFAPSSSSLPHRQVNKENQL